MRPCLPQRMRLSILIHGTRSSLLDSSCTANSIPLLQIRLSRHSSLGVQSRVLTTHLLSRSSDHTTTHHSLLNRSALVHRSRNPQSSLFVQSGPAMVSSSNHGQARGHMGHSHGHGHSHDNTFLTSKNKNDPGVRITRIGLYVNVGMAIGKGIGGYVFNSQA